MPIEEICEEFSCVFIYAMDFHRIISGTWRKLRGRCNILLFNISFLIQVKNVLLVNEYTKMQKIEKVTTVRCSNSRRRQTSRG